MIAIELAARYPSLPAAIVASDPGQSTPYPGLAVSSRAWQLEGPDGEAVRRAYVELLFAAADDADRKRRITETMCSCSWP